MSYSTIRVLFPSACLLALTMAGCGSDGARPFGGDGSGGHPIGNTGGTPGDDGGAAGEPGTGGMPDGTGGVVGSGGMMGTGGGFAASGGRGTGAHPGSGGSGNLGGGGGGFKGSGGFPGSGGRIGTGGGMAASGGNPGSGGNGGGGGPDPTKCDQLAADYLKEMPNAKMCMIGTTIPQCQIQIAASLGCSCGNTTVQTATTLKEIAAKWANEGCNSINRICPLIACIAPQPGACVASTTGTPPQCQNNPTPILLN